MLGDAIDGIGLESFRPRREIGFRIQHDRFEIRLVKGLDARGQRAVAEDEDRRAVFAGDPRRFDGDVKAILDSGGSQDDARAVSVAAEDRLVKVALLDVGRQTGTRSAALDIDNDERNLRHRSPADGLRLQRNPRPGAAGDGEIAGIRKPEGHRDRGQFILAWTKSPPYLGNSLRKISMMVDQGVIG